MENAYIPYPVEDIDYILDDVSLNAMLGAKVLGIVDEIPEMPKKETHGADRSHGREIELNNLRKKNDRQHGKRSHWDYKMYSSGRFGKHDSAKNRRYDEAAKSQFADSDNCRNAERTEEYIGILCDIRSHMDNLIQHHELNKMRAQRDLHNRLYGIVCTTNSTNELVEDVLDVVQRYKNTIEEEDFNITACFAIKNEAMMDIEAAEAHLREDCSEPHTIIGDGSFGSTLEVLWDRCDDYYWR